MDPQSLNASFSTQADELEENNHPAEDSREIMLSLRDAFNDCPECYTRFSKKRQNILEIWMETNEINNFRKDYSLIYLRYICSMFDAHAYVHTATYARYVHRYQNNPDYVDYAVELPKIKHRILEAEVDWYIKSITKDLEIVAKEHCPSFFQPVAEQDPREARHTRTVISHALEQLEAIAVKITPANVKYYTQWSERYSWCLAGMVPLLPLEEQDPFKENGLHQRWQKARNKIQDC